MSGGVDMIQFQADVAATMPEIALAVGAMALLLIGVFAGDRRHALVTWACVALLCFVGYLVATGPAEKVLAFSGTMVIDPFARFLKLLVLGGSAIAMLMSLDYLRDEKLTRFEYPLLVTLATLGMLVMISANDLIVLYVGLELQSLALYVLASFARDNTRSTEAGLKYIVLGALSSGMMLYGSSLLYGFAGTVSFAGIAQAVANSTSLGVVFGLCFLLAGLAFKMSAAPFHMWTPDVYQGAPTPVTAFFASAAKMAAVAITANPSPRPIHPIPSLVVALTLTGAPRAAESESRISSRCPLRRGCSPMTVASTLTGVPSRSSRVRRRRSSESAPAHCSESGGKCVPISP